MLGLLRKLGLELARQLAPVAAGHLLELRLQVAKVLAAILFAIALTIGTTTLSQLRLVIRLIRWLIRLRLSRWRGERSRLIRRVRQLASRFPQTLSQFCERRTGSLSLFRSFLTRFAGRPRLRVRHRLTVLAGRVGLSFSRLIQALGRAGNFFTDTARDRRWRRPILLSRGLSLLRRLLQILGRLLGGLSRLARVTLLRRLLRGLHFLLTVRRLFSGLLRSFGRLRQVERLLAELVLRLGQLLTELSGSVIQFLLTLLLRGIGGSRLLAELLHLLRDLLLFLREVFRLLREFWVRTRVVLQLLGQLLSGLSGLLSGL